MTKLQIKHSKLGMVKHLASYCKRTNAVYTGAGWDGISFPHSHQYGAIVDSWLKQCW